MNTTFDLACIFKILLNNTRASDRALRVHGHAFGRAEFQEGFGLNSA